MSESHFNLNINNKFKNNIKGEEKFFKQSFNKYMDSFKSYKINNNNLTETNEFVRNFIMKYPYFPNDESNYVLKWFKTAFYFYLIELYGNVVIETYSNLERFSINLLIEILSVYPEFKISIGKLLDKKNLDELIIIFLELKILKEQDKKSIN